MILKIRRLLNYVLPAIPQSRSQCGTGRGRLPAASAGRISVEIKARDRSRIGDSAPQYCGATKRSAGRRRRRQDDVFQQPLREWDDTCAVSIRYVWVPPLSPDTKLTRSYLEV